MGLVAKKTDKIEDKETIHPKKKLTTEEFLELMFRRLESKKGQNIAVLRNNDIGATAASCIIVNGFVDRHLRALLQEVKKVFSEVGIKKYRIDGLDSGDWIAVDGYDVMIHLFIPECRNRYQLDKHLLSTHYVDFPIEPQAQPMISGDPLAIDDDYFIPEPLIPMS